MSTPLTRPATGRMRKPVQPCSTRLRSSSCGTSSRRNPKRGRECRNCGQGRAGVGAAEGVGQRLSVPRQSHDAEQQAGK